MYTMAAPGRQLVACLLLALVMSPAAGYLSMNFNQTYYFGPDGPWQGVIVGVGYSAGTHTVNLMPGNLGSSDPTMAWIPNTLACVNYTNSNCGIGGTIPPPPSGATIFSAGETFSEILGPYAYNCTGTGTSGNLLLAPGYELQDVNLGAVTWSYATYLSGISQGLELGFIALGSSPYTFKTSPPYAALEDNYIVSNSYGLHIGSAALGYPGSLIWGGYDKGRIIGPVVSHNGAGFGDVTLRDIVIGVEVGASPFPFASRSGLLLSGGDGNPTQQPLPTVLYPDIPYIFLPRPAMEAIVENLPVTLKGGYYLWNTDDPAYRKIVTSPAYLGFVFPSMSGTLTNANITIKVPFTLLNLTLEPSISGLEKAVPYFPIAENVVSQTDPESVMLGRAFLQAAFIGTNWGNNASWLAQAPGPGKTKSGLGVYPRDILQSDTTLDVESGDTLFRDSWEGYWTPISHSNPTPIPHPNHLTGGDIAGIVIGVVAFIALLIGVILFVKRRRGSSKGVREIDPSQRQSDLGGKSELEAKEQPELEAKEQSELEAKEQPKELPSPPPNPSVELPTHRF